MTSGRPLATLAALMGARRTVFLVVSADPERLSRAGLWAVAAASVDEEVELFLAAPALAALVGPAPEPAAGPPSFRALVGEARAFASVRLVTCDTELKLSGVEIGQARAAVDLVEPLPSFWRRLKDARVVTI